jgi:hypothetical protein
MTIYNIKKCAQIFTKFSFALFEEQSICCAIRNEIIIDFVFAQIYIHVLYVYKIYIGDENRIINTELTKK